MTFKPTSSQMSFFTGNIEIDSYLWNQGVMQVFPKRYSYEELNDAYNRLVCANDSLRTVIEYTGQGVVMRLKDYKYKNYPHWVLESEEELEKRSRDFLNESIDFTDDFVKCAVFETPEVCGIMISGHHAFVDGYSVTVMTEHINKYLHNPDYTPPAHQDYAEYIQNEEKHKTSKRYGLDRDFWLKNFEPVPSCALFSDANNSFDYNSSEVNISIASEKLKKIRSLCQKWNISVQSFFNSVYAAYFLRLTEFERFTLGVPVLNRTTMAEFNTIGLYMHIVPLIIERDDSFSFLDIAQKVEDSQMNLLRHQKYTQSEIKKMLEEKDVRVSKLFDVAIDYQEFNYNDFYEIRLPYSNHLSLPLEIHMQSFGDEKHNLKIRYRTAMFTEEEINIMLNSIIAIMEDALENPDKKISELKMISEDERQKLLYDFNETFHEYDCADTSTLFSLFEKTAKENKEKLCIKTDEKAVTFGEILTVSENLDTRIREITKERKSVVAIIAERSVEMYAAIYGIIRGGNAYLPIDPDYPQERIDYILKNSGAATVVCQGKYISKVKNIPYIDMTEQLKKFLSDRKNIPDSCAKPDDTAYVIYTSGSTGNPKGAKISHRSAINRILWMHDKYPLKENDVILQKTPYTFDVSVWEHFWWGITGGSLAVSKPGEHFLPAKILEEVYKNKVTHLHFVPSVFELFLNYLETHIEEINKFDSVRYVFLSGEALTANLVKRFYKLYNYDNVTLHNLYGPTECAVDVTYYDCNPTDIDPIPIGKPIYNTQMYVVDKHMKCVPIGVTGELCIAGMNVGQGYLNNSDLTKEKFIDNPFGEGKLYKTGDLAYWREDGNIIFEGRKDSQIKINGQRIEIGEIEAVISAVDGVDNCVVLVRKINQRDVLVAFYCGKTDAENEIKDFCSEKLPKYMIPSFVLYLDKLPLNQSGKLDRKMLSEIKVDVAQMEKTENPMDDVEKFVCDAFADILGVSSVGRNSDFFDLGGTSLSMISLISEDGFEDISAAEFIRNSTPAELASIIKNKNKPALEILEELYVPDKMSKAMLLIPFAGGGAESFGKLVSYFKKYKPEMAIYFVPYLHSLDECKKVSEEITNVLKNTEIYLYSHCVGSALAMQILQFLEKEDICIKRYFAGASIPPEKSSGKNIWRIVPDCVIRSILLKAGATFGSLSGEKAKDLLRQFRKDTDYANMCYAELKGKIRTPVNVVLSKKDIFTKNYRRADFFWKKYAYKVKEIYLIDSESHYFQNDAAEELTRIIFSDM